MKKATPAQDHYVKLRTEGGLSKVEAAKIAYPDSKDPNSAAAQAEKSNTVKMMIARYNISQMSMEASGVSYALNLAIVKNQVYDLIKNADGTFTEVHVPAELALRQKSSVELHKSFGFGRIKTKEGEDPFKIGDMDETQLEEFIEKAEAEERNEVRPKKELPLLDDEG